MHFRWIAFVVQNIMLCNSWQLSFCTVWV